MVEERTFVGVTAETWARLCAYGAAEHGTVYTATGDDRGLATTRTVVGEIVLAYERDAARDAVTYRIERKPWLVAPAQVWSGIARAIEACRAEA